MYQREVVLFTRSHSLPSWRAKRFLKHIGYRFDVIDTGRDHRCSSSFRRPSSTR
jgi:hypothetical protein